MGVNRPSPPKQPPPLVGQPPTRNRDVIRPIRHPLVGQSLGSRAKTPKAAERKKRVEGGSVEYGGKRYYGFDFVYARAALKWLIEHDSIPEFLYQVGDTVAEHDQGNGWIGDIIEGLAGQIQEMRNGQTR